MAIAQVSLSIIKKKNKIKANESSFRARKVISVIAGHRRYDRRLWLFLE